MVSASGGLSHCDCGGTEREVGVEGNDAMSNVGRAAQSPKCCKEVGQREHESRNGLFDLETETR